MRRYLRLLRIFWGNTLSTEMEYRAGFWSNAALSLFWLAWAALSVRAFFRFSDSIQGWTYDQLLVVMGLFFAINGLRQMLIQPNLSRMSEYIRMGTLDFLLTKPVSSQFMVSFRHVGVYNWLDPLLGLGLVVFALARSQRPLGLTALLAFSLLSLAGLAVVYAISLMVQSLAIWAIGSEGLDDLIQGMVEAGRFPVQMYRGVVRALLTFVIPVAMLTTFPAQALVGEVAMPVIVNVTLVAVALLWISARIWRLALRHYSGASA
ncbi:MAG TPA: ABC-2 family transporter protein [Acidimicrobiia bacterium]|nr:ABC-2 family transporter protein [Acidimicrobiia bacterium]